jgi:CRISPR-associated protein Csh1
VGGKEMIYDILEVFKKEYEKSGDGLILGLYSLKDGLYVKINKDNTLEFFESKTVKKEKLFTNLNGIQNSDMKEWFKRNDYYSSYINSNKSLFDKKIHNINYLSYFFKLENSDYVKNKIDEHFTILLDFGKFKDKKDKEVLENYQDRLKSDDRKKDILDKCETLKNCFDEILEVAKEKEIKNYVKIFFEEDLEIYKEESAIYLSLKIFNDSSYNKKIGNSIYGLSNSNMGLNSKKPFLENKTRKFSAPFLLKNEDALLLKKFFDWLKIQPYNQDRTLDEEHFFIQKQSNNDEAEITDFDYIPTKKDDVNKYFPLIYVKNYLELENKDKKLISDYEIKELWQLEDKVDELFYNKQLKFNYYKESKDIKVSDFLSKELQSILFVTKFAMINYFKKYNDMGFLNIVNKYGTQFMINHYMNEREFKAKETMNLKLSIQGETMDIKQELENLRTILEDKEYKQLSKDEYLFLAGQWAAYLLSLSHADNKNKTLALAEQYFKAKYISKIQNILNNDLEKFKHELRLSNSWALKAVALLKAYEDDSKLSDKEKDRFLVGFMAKNTFYEKRKKEEDKETNEETK